MWLRTASAGDSFALELSKGEIESWAYCEWLVASNHKCGITNSFGLFDVFNSLN